MALVVLAASDEGLRAREALAELLDVELLESARRRGVVEPLRIVPTTAVDWKDPRYRTTVESGLLELPQGDDEPLVVAVQEVIDVGLRHLAYARHEREERNAKDWHPALVVAPVVVVDGGMDQLVARLDELRAALGVVFRRLAAGSQALLIDAIHVVPWIWLPEVPDEWDPQVFAAPDGYARGGLVPIVYTARTERGRTTRSWSAYGRTRLVGDLMALRGLSASRRSLEHLFPARGAQIDDAMLWRVHSSLYEHPLDEQLRAGRLNQLLASDAARVLPASHELGSLVTRQLDELDGELTGLMQEIAGEIKTGLPPGHFGFSGAYPHRPSPVFAIAPARSERPKWVKSGWSLRTPDRRSDEVHAQVRAALERCASGDLQRELDDALKSAMKQLAGTREKLEARLRASLDWKDVPEQERDRRSGTSDALGRVLALTRGLDARIERLEEDLAQKPADPDTILARFDERKEAWAKREEVLWAEARNLASDGALWLETGALVGAGLALLGIGLALTLPAAWFLWHRRQRDLTQWFERWEMFQAEMKADADDAATQLAAIVDHRIAQLKLVAVRDLRRSLKALEARFRTEVQGLVEEVVEELAVLSRLARERANEPDATITGRFRVEGQGGPRGSLDEPAFHRELVSHLKTVLTLDGMPPRLPLTVHHELLAGLIDRDRAARMDEQGHVDEAAAEQLRAASRYGFSPDERTHLPGTRRVGEAVTLALLGAEVPSRVGTRHGLERATACYADGRAEGEDRIVGSVPAEHALFLAIEQRVVEGLRG